ncbi:MAG: hypothetical protein ACOY3E_16770 [Pseudomonadota bacterium]
MADKKVVFVAFAIEDERIRDMIKGQSLLTNSPFEYVEAISKIIPKQNHQTAKANKAEEIIGMALISHHKPAKVM